MHDELDLDILSSLKEEDSYAKYRANIPAGSSQVPVADRLGSSLGRLNIRSARRYKKYFTTNGQQCQANVCKFR